MQQQCRVCLRAGCSHQGRLYPAKDAGNKKQHERAEEYRRDFAGRDSEAEVAAYDSGGV